jgi:hypothetical protein
MGRFSQFRVVDSGETGSEEEPTLQPPAQPPNNNNTDDHHSHSSFGSEHDDGGDAKRLQPTQPATQPNEKYISPPSQHDSEEEEQQSAKEAGDAPDTPTHEATAAVAAVVPPVNSPDSRDPAHHAAPSFSAASSHQSETPSAAQVSIKTFPRNRVAQPQVAPTPPVAEEHADTPLLAGPHDVAQEKAVSRPESRRSPTASKHAKSNTATASSSSSAHSAAEADRVPSTAADAATASSPTAAAAGAARADPELVLQLSSHGSSQHGDKAPAVQEVESGEPDAVAANTAPQDAESPSQVNVEQTGAAPGDVLTEAPKKKKASAGCSFFSCSKKKKQKEEERHQQDNARAQGVQADGSSPAAEAPQKKKTSALCGIFSNKKKADKDGAANAPSAAQPADQPVDATVNDRADASPPHEGSNSELSIPVAAGAGANEDQNSASQQQQEQEGTHSKKGESELGDAATAGAVPSTPAAPPAGDGAAASSLAQEQPHSPSQAGSEAGAPDTNPVPVKTSHTASSLSFATHSDTPKKEAEAVEEGGKEEAEQADAAPATAAAAVSDGKENNTKDRHVKRVKAVVRRKRQKPEQEAVAVSAEARRAHKQQGSDSETHSSPHDAPQEAEEPQEEVREKETHGKESASAARFTPQKKVSSERAAAEVAPARTSAAHSNKRSSHPSSAKAAPTHSDPYSSYSSYSGSGSYSYSYSYSDSYTASSERNESHSPSHHSTPKKAAPAVETSGAPPPQASKKQQQQPPVQSVQPRSSAAASPLPNNNTTAIESHFTRWSVRADDLVLREEEPPASMPAYQRRILLDLRARERRDAEEAARDLRELTFRPRIHVLPGQEANRSNIIEEERSHSPMGGGCVSPSYSPASGFSDVSPRRYSIRHISPHLLEPRKAPPQPAAPSFKPEISEYARKEVATDRGVFQRLYHPDTAPTPVAAPTYSHKPEISDYAKQLYPVPRGGRLPSRNADHSNRDDSAVRRESVFDRLYRQRNSPGTSPNASPSRSAAHPPSFHPQITELARRQAEGVPKEPVGERLYRSARSPRGEDRSPYRQRQAPNDTITSNSDNNKAGRSDLINGYRTAQDGAAAAENINDHGEYDPQRDYATQREYGVGEVVPQSDRASWTSSSLSQSSFSVKGPTSVKEELRRTFSKKQAAVEAV